MSQTLSILATAALLVATAAPASAQLLRQLTDFDNELLYEALAIDDGGTTLATVSTGDPAGTNPDHERRVLIWDLTTMTPATPGSVTSIVMDSISITDDGQTVAFIATDDPLGTNLDHGPELFVMNVDGTGVIQATSDPSFRREGVKQAKICGDGSRIVFVAGIDPFGSNPNGLDVLYSYTLATQALVALTPIQLQEFESLDISDDGARVAFIANTDLWVVNGGGGGLSRRSTTGDPPVLVSGDGQWVTFREGGDHRRVPWSGGAVEPLATTFAFPQFDAYAISDDAQWLYGEGFSWDLYRIGVFADATELIETDVRAIAADGDRFVVAVAGGSQRIARLKTDLALPTGFHELGTIEADGSGATSIDAPPFTNLGTRPDIQGIALTSDGTTAAYFGRGILGTAATDNSSQPGELPYQADFGVSIPDDGSFVVFDSEFELIPGKGCSGLYSLYTVAPDGSGLSYLGPYPNGCQPGTNPTWQHGRVQRDGSFVAFDDGSNVLRMPLPGSPVTTILPSLPFGTFRDWRLARDGGWVTLGELRVRTDGTDQQVYAPGVAIDVGEPSADGSRIAFQSSSDPLGSNPSGLSQVFVWDDANGLQQVSGTGGSSPKLSGDGAVVAYVETELLRLELGGGPAARLKGTRERMPGSMPCAGGGGFDLSLDGRTIVFTDNVDRFGRNPDRCAELFVADLDTPARIRPGAAAPTVITWDVEPSPVLYDVIRGDVANLQSAGVTIDLGPVACVENDSPDTNTVGSEDVLQPLPGQVFFYLYRGIADIDEGTGAYGTSSDGDERVAASGDCSTIVQ